MPIYKHKSHFGDFNSQHRQAPLKGQLCDELLQIDLNHKKTEKQYRGNNIERNLTRMRNIRIAF